ncbi:NAD(P)/FAD-dependent oxidoreductase [Tessaracoccus antarcticus]|uniref:NADH:ubiquinone reductase (non-electrogenic) n=1 Tax=Tessaracoccus antarcticus TaxID=2479848 RepID=A0A3M0GAI0_9ACTN|nr:NAD(P)/FAD-dependent oxidoreductase [Tessaracoccus antarcticus]RMB61991.1 NAD(P)/FAD-dependent oxidoreductase [Tessaracoccus antarcticus]
MTKRHHVVIIGSGFGGLFSTKALKHADVDITLIARTTHHLFQPLLYQVATGVLSEGEIAPATREILRHQKNAQVLLGLVDDIDLAEKVVKWRFHDEYQETSYDSLIVATGAGQSYFGNDQFARYAPGMKTIDDALELRARIFNAFEVAEFTTDEAERRKLMTFVVVGAGPTGVEVAGQIRELAAATLRRDFRSIDPATARVILVDGADQVLPPFGPKLGRATQKKLEELGVEVKLKSLVTNVDEGGIEMKHEDGTTERIECFCKVWAAGVKGSDLGQTLAEQSGVELDRAGRVKVLPNLTLPGHPEVFVIGDLMSFPDVPGMAQGAIQSGRYVAKTIEARVEGKDEPGHFTYFDKGSMATIAKYSGVVKIGPIRMTGFIAWLAWLFLHLLYIAGFKQRVSTLISWTLSFITNGRSQRVVTNQQLVGRLAIEELGAHSSGRLIRGTVPAAPRSNQTDNPNTLKE